MTSLRLGLVAVLVLGATSCTSAGSSGPTAEDDVTPSSCPTYSLGPSLARDDVERVDVLHIDSAVVIVLHQRDVMPSRAQDWGFVVKTPTASWDVDVLRDRSGAETWVSSSPPMPTTTPEPDGCGLVALLSADGVDCPGGSADIDPLNDRVQVVVPRRCLGNPDWVQVGATVWDGDHAPTESVLGPRVPVR